MSNLETKLRDLGLSYQEATHGVQSAIKFEMERGDRNNMDHIKHLRVGLDMRASDHAALATLLIAKGAFTEAEYIEQMRLAANEELARYEDHVREKFDLPEHVSFR